MGPGTAHNPGWLTQCFPEAGAASPVSRTGRQHLAMSSLLTAFPPPPELLQRIRGKLSDEPGGHPGSTGRAWERGFVHVPGPMGPRSQLT